MASDITQHRPGAERPPSAEETTSSSDAAPMFPWAESTLDAQPALSLGFWAAVLATAFTVLFVVLAVVFASAEWSGIEDYARNFDSLQMAQLVPVLLLAPTVVVISCECRLGPGSRRARRRPEGRSLDASPSDDRSAPERARESRADLKP